MNCQDYLALYSELLDEQLGLHEEARVRAHAVQCPSCARYDRVLRRGLQLVKTRPEITASTDFYARLQHALFHVRDDMSRDRFAASGAIAALGIAALIALAAWTPVLTGTDTADEDAFATAASQDDAPVESSYASESTSAWSYGSAATAFSFASASGLIAAGYSLDAATFPGPYSPLIVSPPMRGGGAFLIRNNE